MPDTVSVTSTAHYSTDTVPNASVSANDSVDMEQDGSASGGANSGGASTSIEYTESSGDKVERTREADLPEGATFISAEVSITRTCGDEETHISLNGSGNVSATASANGDCIEVVEVSRQTAQGVTETVRRTKKKCCEESG